MNLLYDNGRGTTYKNMLQWMDSENTALVSTGILAIGNFARNDLHCFQMIEDGTAAKLLS